MRRVFGAIATSAISPSQHTTALRTASLSCRGAKRTYADDASSSKPSHPFDGYYTDLLDAPLRSVTPAVRAPPSKLPVSDEPAPQTEKDVQIAKARVVFGSRLAGPGERKRAIDAQSKNVAGVMVPPRPEEPDNCCMSGCVNCVWDQYRDEMEEWAAKTAEARVRIMEERKGVMTGGAGGDGGGSMDDDGGGSESNWSMGGEEADKADLFKDIPVGIREFMRTEKKLKDRRKQGVI